MNSELLVAIIGVFFTALGGIYAFKQYYKKDSDTTNNSINQNIRGGLFFKSNISQNVSKKEE